MLVERIYQHYEERNDEASRYHLGASQLGNECERATWLSYRWFAKEKFEGRMLRLFETGQLAEARFISDLEAIGVKVKALHVDTQLQYRVTALGGHFGGSMDGIATGIDPDDPEKEYVLEFKTHNERSFAELKKHGVDKAKRQHFVQMQIYMGLSEIHQALYLAVNKNTDELYEEIVLFNKEMFDLLMQKARRIITAADAPVRIHESPSFFKCKMCSMAQVCRSQDVASTQLERNCRTCIHSEPAGTGLWQCNKIQTLLSEEQQRAGCEQHEAIKL